MNLKELKNKTILLFGRSRAFSSEEFSAQLKYHDIKLTNEYSDEVALSIDGKMMTPYEQNSSDELYESKKVKSITIESLEKSLAQEIDEDTLLMSLKLSHDKERLKSFIQNEMISDKLFFRLLKLYSWENEDFFENDDNRDVSASFISRFYENIERNHNVQYATTGFIHLVAQTKNLELLKAISELQPLKYHPKIKSAIAMSRYCDEAMQKQFYKSSDERLLEALSFNEYLSEFLVEKFLEEKLFIENIAKSIKLNEKLFNSLKEYPVFLAQNENLDEQMQNKLLELGESEVNISLSKNNYIDTKVIDKLLSLNNEKIKNAIYQNSSTPIEILKEGYKNPEYHIFLAKNENTPIDILYQLQLDSRYERFVKTNPTYGRHIQTQNIGWEL